jgi:imidazolonepropionase-like amidohydrolase
MYLIPGLWDMHVHVMYRGGYDIFGPVFVAQGITGIRDMGNSPMPIESMRSLRDSLRRGEIVGPRFVAAGPILDGPGAFWPFAIKIESSTRARAVVDSLSAERPDFLKVYTDLPVEAYLTIAARAHELGLVFAGHVPTAVSIEDAAAQGQRSMEHLLGVSDACAENLAELVAERERLSRGNTDFESMGRRLFSITRRDDRKCAALFTRLAKSDTWHVPTLSVLRVGAFPLDSSALRDPRMDYVIPPIRSWWTLHPRDTSTGAWDTRKRRYEGDARNVAEMHRAGVRILAGTDAPNRFLYPGFSLHQELRALTDAGLSPLDALRAATLEPAKYLAATDSLGAIRAGFIADLVLLHGNPLEDIRQTERIAGVVLNGRYFDRAALDRLMHNARVRARQ